MAKTVADKLVERLVAWGVDTVFGFPGDGINGIFEALRTHRESLKFIQVRHEEAAAFAAVGYAKYTGQPVLAITGHTFHDMIGTHYQQDVDLDKLFMDVAAYNQRVMGPAHVRNVVDEAIKTALARRGVTHITIPKDIQDWTSKDEERSSANIPHHSADLYAAAYPLPHEDLLRQAADIINA